jgi:membrane protease subunit HflC
MKQIIGISVAALVLLVLVGKPFYTVDEREQVLILQFGKPVGVETEPGLKFKLPFIQNVQSFPKILLEWDGEPGQIPTKDKTFIWIDTFARWRIKDPLTFFRAVRTEMAAQEKLDAIIDSATYDYITTHNLIEAVRTSNRLMKSEKVVSVGLPEKLNQQVEITMGREKMTRGIMEQVAPKMVQLGIEIEDFRIKRINYVEEVRKKVYERMIAERKQISEKFRSEGQGESKSIEGERQKELRRIKSEAYRTAEETKGTADAEAIRIYADAFNRDPEFYSFINTLAIYKESLDESTNIIMSTDSEFFKYLKNYKKQ